MSDTIKVIVTDKNKVKAFFAFIGNAVKNFFKQLYSLPTDKKWDVDAQKTAGLAIIALGFWVIIVVILDKAFNSSAPNYGVALITIGSGLLGWRSHTDL